MKSICISKLLNIITAVMVVVVLCLPALAYFFETKYDASDVLYTKTLLRGSSMQLSGNIDSNVEMEFVRITLADDEGETELQQTAYAGKKTFDLSRFNNLLDTEKLTQGSKTLTITCYNKSESAKVYTGYLTAINPTAQHVRFSLEPGGQDYRSALTLSTATEDADIYYTTDGTVPTRSSTLYTGEMILRDTVDINAVAYKEGMSYSGVTSAKYYIIKPQPTALFLDKEMLTLKPGESYRLRTKVLPAEIDYAEVHFTSSNPKVAEVDATGLITVKGDGIARIIAITDNGLSTSCYITSNITHTHYHQGDDKWNLSDEVKSKLCLTTSYAMVLTNMGFETDPEKLYYEMNGEGATNYRINRLYDVEHVPAISSTSSYYMGMSNGRTYIKNPGKNGEDAAKEALKKNPEGVIMYFKNGENMHAVVAIGVNKKGELIFSDPGRKKALGHKVTFEDSWLGIEGYDMSHLDCIIAMD